MLAVRAGGCTRVFNAEVAGRHGIRDENARMGRLHIIQLSSYPIIQFSSFPVKKVEESHDGVFTARRPKASTQSPVQATATTGR